MIKENTFPKFAYFDTNILSTLAKDESQWLPLQKFLRINDLSLAIGEGQIAEFNSDTRLHKPLNDLLTSVPAALVKTHDVILDEEVKSHPKKRTDTLLQYSLNKLLGENDLETFLSSPSLTTARDEQKAASQIWSQRLVDLKSNFPPHKSGKYIKSQAPFFAWTLTIQELRTEYLDFLKQFQNDVGNLEVEVFLSSQIVAYVLFYKYYLTAQDPRLSSDFGDIFHLRAMPYCRLVVVEKNMCEILNQIKKNTQILENVEIKNINFLKDWKLK